MPNDNSQSSEAQAEPLSPEVADYFQEGTPQVSEAQNVTPDTTGQTNDTKEEVKDEEVSTDEVKTDDQVETPDTDDDKEETPTTSKTYKIGSREFKSQEEAIEIATKVYGENSRLAGDLKVATQRVEEFNSKLSEKDKLIEELAAANKQWQDYYNGDSDEEPKQTVPAIDVKKVIEETLSEKEQQKALEARREQYSRDAEEVTKYPDIDKVLPEMNRVLTDYFNGDTNKIGPKELYKMAKGLMGESNQSVDEVVESINKKKVAQKAALSVIGGNSRKTQVTAQEDNLSPEVADYFKNNI